MERTSVFGSERLTGTLLDRLIHHVHNLESFTLSWKRWKIPGPWFNAFSHANRIPLRSKTRKRWTARTIASGSSF